MFDSYRNMAGGAQRCIVVRSGTKGDYELDPQALWAIFLPVAMAADATAVAATIGINLQTFMSSTLPLIQYLAAVGALIVVWQRAYAGWKLLWRARHNHAQIARSDEDFSG